MGAEGPLVGVKTFVVGDIPLWGTGEAWLVAVLAGPGEEAEGRGLDDWEAWTEDNDGRCCST